MKKSIYSNKIMPLFLALTIISVLVNGCVFSSTKQENETEQEQDGQTQEEDGITEVDFRGRSIASYSEVEECSAKTDLEKRIDSDVKQIFADLFSGAILLSASSSLQSEIQGLPDVDFSEVGEKETWLDYVVKNTIQKGKAEDIADRLEAGGYTVQTWIFADEVDIDDPTFSEGAAALWGMQFKFVVIAEKESYEMRIMFDRESTGVLNHLLINANVKNSEE